MRFVVSLLLSMLACPVWGGVIEGRVIEVPEGDTLTVLASEGASIHKVRLAGIDAPALDSPYGGSARENLRRLARGKTVRVDTTAIDPKGRLVGIVQVLRDPRECGGQPCDDRLDPGLTQLAAGMATLDKTNLSYQSDEAQRRYAFAEAHARSNRLGLWRDPRSQFPVRAEVR